MLTIFDWNFEVWAVQKYANLVDLVKSFPTSIYVQKSASIQPRTSLSKFEVMYSWVFIRLLSSVGACAKESLACSAGGPLSPQRKYALRFPADWREEASPRGSGRLSCPRTQARAASWRLRVRISARRCILQIHKYIYVFSYSSSRYEDSGIFIVLF